MNSKKNKMKATMLSGLRTDIIEPSDTIALPIAINIQNILPNPNNIRSVDTSSESFDALLNSIRDIGLQQNLVVYEKIIDKKKKYILTSGHRRFAAIQKLHEEDPDNGKWLTVPCLVEKLKSDEKSGISVELEERMHIASTNLHVEGLKRKEQLAAIITSIEYYEKKHPDIKSKKMINEAAASSIGMSIRRMYEIKSLDENLIPELNHAYFDNESLTYRVAKMLSNLRPKDQKAIFDHFSNCLDSLSVQMCQDFLNSFTDNIKSETTADKPKEKNIDSDDYPQDHSAMESSEKKSYPYPEIPNDFLKERMIADAHQRKFTAAATLNKHDLLASPTKDIDLIKPENLKTQDVKMGKTDYNKYVRSLNLIGKQLRVISDLIEKNINR